MKAQLEQWLANLRPLMGVLIVDIELGAAADRWVRQGPGPWGGRVDDASLAGRASHYAQAWRHLAYGAATVVTAETSEANVLLQAVDAGRLVAFIFDPKTPLGLARLHALRAMPHVAAALDAGQGHVEAPGAPPTGPPVTASYADSDPVGAEDDDAVEPLSSTTEAQERPGLPPPTQPPGPAPPPPGATPAPPGPLPFQPSVTPAPPGPVPISAGPIPTTPGTGVQAPPPVVPGQTSGGTKQPAPTLTSADQFRGIENDETQADDASDPSPETRIHEEPAPAKDSAQYAGPVAGATRPTTTLTEASTETAARGVRVLAYLDAHAEDAHLALLRVSLQTGLAVETLRDPENLSDDEVDFVAASVRRILGRPLEM